MRAIFVKIIIGMAVMAGIQGIPFQGSHKGPSGPAGVGHHFSNVAFSGKLVEAKEIAESYDGRFHRTLSGQTETRARKHTLTASNMPSVQRTALQSASRADNGTRRQILGLFVLLSSAKASRGF